MYPKKALPLVNSLDSAPDKKARKKEKKARKKLRKVQKAAAVMAAREAAPTTGPRVVVRSSGVHGKGMFARRFIAEGERIIEYKGEVITWKEAQERHPHDPSDPNHTFYFHIDDERVIDGLHGNTAKWINHSCAPNCEAEQDEDEGRVFIHALRDIEPGEELNYDYGLIIEDKLTKKLKREYACRCGSRKCRGTMLATRKD